jgi:hypothetical protein
MPAEIAEIMSRYRCFCVHDAEKLLMPPAKAAMLLDDLEAAGIGVARVSVWYLLDGNFFEEPDGLDLRGLAGEPGWAAASVGAARRFVSREELAAVPFVAIVAAQTGV